VLKPTQDRVLLRRLAPEGKRGSIIIPDAAQRKSERAVVVAVGPGKPRKRDGARVPVDVVQGDVVIAKRVAGSEVRVGVETLWMVHESEILAVLERGDVPPEGAVPLAEEVEE
jgi:chaperonin GroES